MIMKSIGVHICLHSIAVAMSC